MLIVTFFLWGHAEVVLGFFLSNFFGRPRTATIVGYLLVIAGVIVALLLEALQVRVMWGGALRWAILPPRCCNSRGDCGPAFGGITSEG